MKHNGRHVLKTHAKNRHFAVWKGATGFSFALAVASIGCAMPNVSNAATTAVVKPYLLPPCDGGGDGGVIDDGIRAQRIAFLMYGTKVTPPSATVAQFGATQDKIRQNFAGVVENHFNGVGAENILNRLSDRELARLATHYQARAGTGNSRLLQILASRLSDRALLRVASAFGRDAVKQAVVQNASAAVKASFLAKAIGVMPLTTRPEQMPLPPPPPPSTGWTNTLEEIYLDYRTSELGLSVGEALSATTIYSLAAVAGAWEAGTKIGDGVSYLITNYDPSLSDAIGGTVAGMINQGNTATTYLQQGQVQNSFDSLFGLPISNSTDPAGPDNLTAPMLDWYNTYGPPLDDPGYDGGGGGGCE